MSGSRLNNQHLPVGESLEDVTDRAVENLKNPKPGPPGGLPDLAMNTGLLEWVIGFVATAVTSGVIGNYAYDRLIARMEVLAGRRTPTHSIVTKRAAENLAVFAVHARCEKLAVPEKTTKGLEVSAATYQSTGSWVILLRARRMKAKVVIPSGAVGHGDVEITMWFGRDARN